MTVFFSLDIKNNASVTKDRTGLFFGKPQFVASESTGRLIAMWCEKGVDAPVAIPDIEKAISEMGSTKTVDELKDCWTKWKQFQSDQNFSEKKEEMKQKLSQLKVA